MHRVLLGLGSNLAARLDNLAAALRLLEERVGPAAATSRIYESDPVGFADQPRFWNLALAADTTLDPLAAFRAARDIERAVGRTPTFPNGPRIIDIDVLLYDDIVIADDALQVPHPRMHQRAFVLRPLAEIAPDTLHPLLRRTIADLAADVADQHAEPLDAESAQLRTLMAARHA